MDCEISKSVPKGRVGKFLTSLTRHFRNLTFRFSVNLNCFDKNYRFTSLNLSFKFLKHYINIKCLSFKTTLGIINLRKCFSFYNMENRMKKTEYYQSLQYYKNVFLHKFSIASIFTKFGPFFRTNGI